MVLDATRRARCVRRRRRDEALALLGERRPDVMVSDIGMPGEDGYSLMRKVAAGKVPLPGIALSAFTSGATSAPCRSRRRRP